MRSSILVACALSLMATGLGAQTVHLVDGVQHATVESAYAVAAPDDVILLRLTRLPAFNVSGKGVVIRSETTTEILGPSSVRSVPSRQTMMVEGLSFQFTTPAPSTALTIANCAGAVALRNITVAANALLWGRWWLGGTGITGLWIDGCTSVDVSRCSFAAGHADPTGGLQTGPYYCAFNAGLGIRVRGSNVSLFDTFAAGGNGSFATLGWTPLCTSGDGLLADNSIVNAVGCEFQMGAAAVWFVAAGMNLNASKASLSACERMDDGYGDSRSQFVLYGPTGSGWLGSTRFSAGTIVRSTRRLPELRERRISNDLFLDSRYAPPYSSLFVAFSARPSFFDFTPHGSHAALLLSFDHTSGLLLTATHDGNGNASEQVHLPPALIAALGHREIFLQGLSAFPGGPWMCSNLVSFHLQ